MAKKILISTVVIGANRYYAGALLDESAEAGTIAAVIAAGGQLVDQGDPIVDAAALTAQQRLRDGQWQDVDRVMLAAVSKSAYAAAPPAGGAGPQRDLYVNLQSSEVDIVGIAENIASYSTPFWGEGIRNGVVVFQAGWEGGDIVWDGTLRGAAVQQTFVSPGVGGGTVVGTQLFTTVTLVTNTAPAGSGAQSAQLQPGRLVGTTRAPLASVEKVTMGGDPKTPVSVDLTAGWVETPDPVVLGTTVEIASVVA